MESTIFLREQIERAKRLAAAMTTSAERDRLLRVAEEYQHHLDAPPGVPTTAKPKAERR